MKLFNLSPRANILLTAIGMFVGIFNHMFLGPTAVFATAFAILCLVVVNVVNTGIKRNASISSFIKNDLDIIFLSFFILMFGAKYFFQEYYLWLSVISLIGMFLTMIIGSYLKEKKLKKEFKSRFSS